MVTRVLTYLVWTTTLCLMVGSAVLWTDKSRRAVEASALDAPVVSLQRERALAMLKRAFEVDTSRSYAAACQTEVLSEDRVLASRAQVVHTPKAQAIRYLDGPMQGMEAGYNGRWMWRGKIGATMESYAELPVVPLEMARRRFAVMRQNYEPVWMGQEQVAGQDAEVIELRPRFPVDGATGPAKRLWINPTTGLTLRVMTLDHLMRPVMQTTLDNVDWQPRVDGKTFVSTQSLVAAVKAQPQGWMAQDMGRSPEDFRRVAQVVGLYPPRPTYVPKSFVLCSVGVHRYGSPVRQGAMTRYTDGLNTLTLFALPKEAAPLSPGETCRFGSGLMVMRDVSGQRLIVVADLPLPILERVADGARLQAYGQ